MSNLRKTTESHTCVKTNEAICTLPLPSRSYVLWRNRPGVTPDVGTSGNNISTDDPRLDSLADNGGPTQTHALRDDSLAIDAGDPSILFDPAEFDQRGAPLVRVFNDPGVTGFRIGFGVPRK